jgi:peptidyl-prolyl cis-trans isomerase D
MLLEIRDRATGLFAYIILILISIPFALWGIQSYFEGGGQRLAAEVNGEEIPVRAYQNALQEQQQRLREMFGGKIPEGVIDQDMIKHQTIDSLIRDIVITQEIQSSGYRVGDRELVAEIEAMPVFQTNGKFDPQRYDRMLQQQRLTKPGFEQQMRNSLTQVQFQEGIVNSAFYLNDEAADISRLMNQQRSFDLATLSPESFRNQAQATEQEIQDYYQNNQNQFLTTERVKVEYIDLQVDAIAQSLPVDEDEALDYFENQKSVFRAPELRQVRHILFTVGATQNEQQARDRAAEVVALIESGKDFAELARQYSQDRFTAKQGGNLGEIGPGEMGEEFDRVAFSLAPGETSSPVKTERGIEIIFAEKVILSEEPEFADVKDRVYAEIRSQKAENRFLELTEKVATLSYEVPDTLNEAADAVGIRIQASAWFDRQQGEDLFANPAVRAAAFSNDVLEKGQNSDLLDLEPGRTLVLRVLEHEVPQQRPLEEVRDLIRNVLATQKMQQMVRSAGQEKLEKLVSGAQWEGETSGLTLQSGHTETRDSQAVDAGVLKEVFSMPRPDAGTAYAGYSTPGGEYILIRLTQVDDGDTESAVRGISARTDNGVREYKAATDVLKERAEIQVYNDNL